MKPNSILRYGIIACLLFIVLSCHKRKDFEVNCRIIRVANTDPNFPGSDYEGFFEYTSWGDPSKITWSATTTGRPNYDFIYDNKKRLTKFIATYEGVPGFEFYTKYIYNAGNVIVADTLFYFGDDLNDPRGSALGYILNYYTYDSKGRITRIDSQNQPGGYTYFRNYTYDSNGNLVRGGTTTYDNKKNYLRTNLVLMFISRDYSVNNYIAADTYNNKGLPLTFSTDIYFQNAAIDEIDYNCGHYH